MRRADAAAVDGLRLVLQLGGQLDRHAEPAELHRRRVLLAAMRRHASLAASPFHQTKSKPALASTIRLSFFEFVLYLASRTQ